MSGTGEVIHTTGISEQKQHRRPAYDWAGSAPRHVNSTKHLPARRHAHFSMTRRTLTIGNQRFLVGPWHDGADIAYVSIAPASRFPPTSGAVIECLRQLAEDGYRSAVTAAMRPSESAAFSAAGFAVRERLPILRHDLTGDLSAERPLDLNIRRARRADRNDVLALDALAFDEFWHLGGDGLREALGATTSTRFRVMAGPDILGYSICGRTLDVGYLQRLAVHPEHLRNGIGSALVLDALRWLKRRRAGAMLVNTQESNADALALYERLGFVMEHDHLSVMAWDGA